MKKMMISMVLAVVLLFAAVVPAYAVVSDSPAISGLTVFHIGGSQAAISFSLDRDFGSAIEESGFLLGRTNSVAEMTYYKAANGTTKGVKEHTVYSLASGATYYVRGYSRNGAGETITPAVAFTTRSDEVNAAEREDLSLSGNHSGGFSEELTLSDDYPQDDYPQDDFPQDDFPQDDFPQDDYPQDDFPQSDESDEEGEPVKDFSVSAQLVDFQWDDLREVSLSVSGDHWKIQEIEYIGVPASAVKAGYHYQWLIADQRGDELVIRPSRTNYSYEYRTAVVRISNGELTKEITVLQDACGEAAPCMVLSSNGKTLRDGSAVVLEAGEQLRIDVAAASNIRRVFAQLIDANGSIIGECSDLNFSFPSLAAGTYKVQFWASNSTTANDFYGQSPFDSGTMVIRATVEPKKSAVTDNKAPTTAVPSTGNSLETPKTDLMQAYLESSYYQNLQSVSLSGDYAEDIVNVGLSQVGYKEVDGQSAYGQYYGDSRGPWCAYFISFCKKQAGIPDSVISFCANANPGVLVPNGEICLLISKEKYEKNIESWRTQKRQTDQTTISFPWLSSSRVSCMDRSDYVPRKGDLIFWGSTDGRLGFSHVGLVTANSDGKTFSYIDGNGSGDDVSHQVDCSLSAFNLVAYARPNYSGNTKVRAVLVGGDFDGETVEHMEAPMVALAPESQAAQVQEKSGFSLSNVWDWLKSVFGF